MSSTHKLSTKTTSRSLLDEPRTWLGGGMLALSLWMVTGILSIICLFGLTAFWPRPIDLAILADGSLILGQPVRERFDATLYDLGESATDDKNYLWVNQNASIEPVMAPARAVLVENAQFGRRIGFLTDDIGADAPTALSGNSNTLSLVTLLKSQPVAQSSTALDAAAGVAGLPIEFATFLSDDALMLDERHALRLGDRSLLFSVTDDNASTRVFCASPISALESQGGMVSALSELRTVEIPRASIHRILTPNQLNYTEKLSAYVQRWAEFLTAMPRGTRAGGMLPAIVGTVVLTLMMIVGVIPLGVLAALYLREFHPDSWSARLLRAGIQNMAGVPSILFGVVGLTFFCYGLGSYIDGGPTQVGLAVWEPTWWALVLGLTCGLAAACLLLAWASGRPRFQAYQPLISRALLATGVVCASLALALIIKSPFFQGFHADALPNPTFGKGGILWSAVTLAVLTLPTVIVNTEEALSVVPASLSDGSFACGAGKWQTLRRVVLPYAAPGIWTGIILAMARGVGSVAPLMLVGVVASTNQLPLDGASPYLHAERGFMHLGHQVYHLGFESGDPEGSRTLVVTTALLLVLVVASLNLTANYFRGKMRRRIEEGTL